MGLKPDLSTTYPLLTSLIITPTTMDIIESWQAYKTIDGKFDFFCMKGIVRIDNKLYLAS